MPGKSVRLGGTEVSVDSMVRDSRGVADIISDALEADFQEARFKNFNQRLFPFADAADIVEWDSYLTDRYAPLYLNFDATCSDCPLGPCNLKIAVGRCGLQAVAYQARLSLRRGCRGCLSQVTDSRETLNHAVKVFGPEAKVSWGNKHDRSDTNHISLMTGMWPVNLRDLQRVMSYVEEQLSRLFLGSYNGLDSIELERMSLHAGSILLAAMDLSELVKMSLFGFTNASNHELTEMINWPPANVMGGLGNVEAGKPVLTFMGDNFLPAWYAIKGLQEGGIAGKVEVCGIGSVAHDIIRFYDRCRVLSPMVTGQKIVRLGLSDVIVASTACINWDFLPDAKKAGTRVIWTSNERNLGLPDRTDDPVESIVDDLAGGAPGAWVRDVEKAATIAVKLIQVVKRVKPRPMSEEEAKKAARKCKASCDLCLHECPNGLLVGPALRKVTTDGLKAMSDVEDGCYFCGRCESVCPQKIPLLDLITATLGVKAPEDKLKMRAGRGPVPRVETTGWAFGSIWGNCPGIFHIMGCGDARHRGDLGWLAYQLVWRNAIVFVVGCGAGEVGRYFNEKKQQYVFEEFGAEGQARNMINCGGCSACCHVADQALKWPRSGAGISFYANYAETADNQHNLLAPSLIVWGALTDRMYAIVAAWVRAGMSVIIGPNSAFSWKRVMLRSKWRWEDWWTLSQFGGRKMYVEPAPFSMILPAETKEEAIALAEVSAIRAADIRDSRQIRLDTYIEFYEKFYGEFPDDWQLYVRSDWELPLRYKSRLLRLLRENYGWEVDRLQVKRARHPDGRLLTPGEFSKEYGAMAAPVTKLPRMVTRNKGYGKQEAKAQ